MFHVRRAVTIGSTALLVIGCRDALDKADQDVPTPDRGGDQLPDEGLVDDPGVDPTAPEDPPDPADPPGDDPIVPPTLEVVVSDRSAEIDDAPLTITTIVRDPAGVELPDAAVTLSVSPSSVTLTGDALVFHADGRYTVTGVLDSDPTVTDQSERVTVDSNGPVITLTSPERGSWLAGSDTITVAGTATDPVTGVWWLTLGGETVPVAADGSFSTSVDVAPGIQVLELESMDADGNRSDLVASFAHGPTSASGDPIASGLDVRLDEEALRVIAAAVADALSAPVLEAQVVAANPMADQGLPLCSHVVVDAESFTFGAVEVTLVPAAGAMSFTAEIADVLLGARSTVDTCFSPPTQDDLLFSDVLTVATGDVNLTVVAGVVAATATVNDVSFTDFQEDWGTLGAVLGFVGWDVGDLGIDSRGLVSDNLAAALEAAVPAALVDTLNDVATTDTVTWAGIDTTLDGRIGDLRVDPAGLTMALDLDVSATPADPAVPASPGSLLLGEPTPTRPRFGSRGRSTRPTGCGTTHGRPARSS